MFRKNNSKYRQEGLSLMQASRMKEERHDESSKLLIAGLSVVAVGCLAYVGVQKVNVVGTAPTLQAEAPLVDTATQSVTVPTVPDDPTEIAARLSQISDIAEVETASLNVDEPPVAPEVDLSAVTQIAEAPVSPELSPGPAPETETVAIELAAIEPEIEVAAVDLSPTPEEEPVELLQAAVEPELLSVASSSEHCFAELQAAASESTIFFGSGSAFLTGKDLAVLTRISQMANDCSSARIHITGHSDTSGNDLTNLNLSWQRADNTLAAMEQLGYDTSKFEPVGFGARSPLSQGDASDDELNRRVEFVILKDVEGN